MSRFLIFIGACLCLCDAEYCVTPLGQTSRCVPIYQCPQMMYRIQNGIDQQTVDFLWKSRCKSDFETQTVCCGPLPNNIIRKDETFNNRDDSEDFVLPSNSECGREPLSYGDRIIGGSRSDIGESPWLALLWYRQHNTEELKHKCGGMLINHRYVLTAAHCLTGRQVDSFGRLESVSLGEHDIRNATDCIDGTCSDPPQIVRVLDSYPHPGFTDRNLNKKDDIGLIKLASRVEYTDFVQPICLDRSGIWEVGDEVIVAGWGKTLSDSYSSEKLKVALSIANNVDCFQQFRSHHKVTLSNSQFCAGGEFLKDACSGDSGGPAMRQSDGQWEAIGIISFGFGCGRDSWPGIYTKVSSYFDWITETLRSSNSYSSNRWSY